MATPDSGSKMEVERMNQAIVCLADRTVPGDLMRMVDIVDTIRRTVNV
jgi:hypothetical protein